VLPVDRPGAIWACVVKVWTLGFVLGLPGVENQAPASNIPSNLRMPSKTAPVERRVPRSL